MGHRKARGQQSELMTVLDGETDIQEKAQTLDRFANQFDQLLNMTGEVDGSALDIIAQRPNITLVDENLEMRELLDAINATKEGKALGRCGIPAEIWKHCGCETRLQPIQTEFCTGLEKWLTKYQRTGKMPLSCQSSRREVERTVGAIVEAFLVSGAKKILARSHTPQNIERTNNSQYLA